MRQRILAGFTLGLIGTAAIGAPVGIDTTNAQNGLYDIWSFTFDGALTPCGPGDPAYCTFFGGKPQPGATRSVVLTPDPTGVKNGVPLGITPTPTAGSFLDLSADAGHLNLTLSGGVIAFPDFTMTIVHSTVANISGAGMVFDAAPQTVAMNASGQAEFLVNLAPALAVDFSTLSSVVTSCTGPFCGLLPVVSFDMVRYRLFVDYDPTFTTFTADFIGQTGNNSLIYANLNAVPVPAAIWLLGSALGVLGYLRRRVPHN